jgi:hypothetical protein
VYSLCTDGAPACNAFREIPRCFGRDATFSSSDAEIAPVVRFVEGALGSGGAKVNGKAAEKARK